MSARKLSRSTALAAAFLSIGVLPACRSAEKADPPQPVATGPDYSRPLPPGASALRKITNAGRMPDLGLAFRNRDPLLLEAMRRSLAWFDKPSSRGHFQSLGEFSHQRAKASVAAMIDLLESATTQVGFSQQLTQMFDVYESVGYDGSGIVLYTGYYSPVFEASEVRTSQFSVPLYTRPDDLATDPQSGQPLGRRTASGDIVPYYTRREIERSQMFAGRELVWLKDDMDAYIIHVNGSAKLRMPDGSSMYIGYAGKTDRPYASLGQAARRGGLVDPNSITLSSIKRAYQRNPAAMRELMYENQNYVFFQRYPSDNWPAGSLGFPVTAERSLATDKRIYPRASVVLVDTQTVTFSGRGRRFVQFMLDQDTGGAIQAPGRADIFMGVGAGAETLAGAQYAEGRLYYFFIKPEHLDRFEAGEDKLVAKQTLRAKSGVRIGR